RGAFFLRRERLAPRRRPLGGDDAIERTVGIAFARLMIEDEDDLAFHVAVVVVVRQRRSADPETGENDWPSGVACGAEAEREELLALTQVSGCIIGDDDVERVAVGEGR